MGLLSGVKKFVEKNLPESDAGRFGMALATGGLSEIGTVKDEFGNLKERITGEKPQRDALNKINAAKTETNQLFRDVYDQTRSDFAPYRDFGASYLDDLGEFSSSEADFSGLPEVGNYEESEALRFIREQGNEDILNAAGAIGTGGGTLKALENFRQGVNAQFVNDEFARQTSQRNQLFNEIMNKRKQRFGELDRITGTGLNAAAQIGNAGSTFAGNTADTTVSAANAAAAADINKGNMYNQLLQSGMTFGLNKLLA